MVKKRFFKPKNGSKKRKGDPTKKESNKPIAESGDADDFEHLLGTMPDREEQQLSDDDNADGNGTTAEPKKKKRRKTKGQQMNAMTFEASRRLAAQISDLPATDQADWLWNDFTKHGGPTELERETEGLDENSIQVLTPDMPLENQLKAIEPNWRNELCTSTGKPAGSPRVIVISPAAMGAVSFIKACPEFNRGCKIGKLFAKHFKVEEQQGLLKNTPLCIAAGTPNRLAKLADLGALKMDSLRLVLLDVQLDAKQRTILDIPEVRADFWAFWNGHLKKLVTSRRVKIGLVKCPETA